MCRIDLEPNEDYFKDPIHLNKFALDFEWERQAYLMYHFGDAACEAQQELNDKQLEFNYRKANIAKEYRQGIRTIPNVQRLTEGGIKEAVESDEELYELQKEINYLKSQYDLAMNAVRSLSQKKHAIEHEVQLYFAKYFSSPRQKAHGTSEFESDEMSDSFFQQIKNTRKNE